MWVHEQGLGGEQSLLGWWDEPNHARRGHLKKSAFLGGEGERELSMLGFDWRPWGSPKGAQGQALTFPRSMAPKVRASGVCVYEKFPLRKLSMKA